jgi:hypothetical protein
MSLKRLQESRLGVDISYINQGFRILAKPAKTDEESFSPKEAQERFEAALRGGLNTPAKPLKDKPKVKKAVKKKKSAK